MQKPVIGITPTPSTDTMGHGSFYRFCLSDTYVRSVQQAGGIPVILPSTGDASDVLAMLDGVILSGGGDIDPALFTNDEKHEETGRVDHQRDTFELELMRLACDHNLPTFAICRGIQVMTVAFGGTLHQHVPSNVANAIEHRQQASGYTQHEVSHLVTFDPTSNPFTDILEANELMVNSYHHQAPAHVPSPLRIAGRAADGVIEAIYHPGMSFGLGVQCHPEMLAHNFPLHARLFSRLVEAARTPAGVA